MNSPLQQPPLLRFSWKQLGVAVLGAGIGLFFCWLAFRQVDWESVAGALTAATWLGTGAAVLLKVASDLVRAVRWRCLWTEHDVSVPRLYVVETAAVGLNNLSPVHVLDEPLILALLTIRDRLPAGAVLVTMVMTRVQDLTFTVLFAGIAVFLVPDLLELVWPIALSTAALIGALLVIYNLRWIVDRFPRLARIPVIVGFSVGIADLRRRPQRLLLTFSLTVAYWGILVIGAWALGASMGIGLPVLPMALVVLGAIFFGTAVPSLPGGIGTFEWAVITLLGIWDVPPDPALAFGLVLHVVLFVPSTLVTVIVLPREGIGSVRALRLLLGVKSKR
ncbi:MAG: lysylphosphatidylglycerol synthase transmembrane domain-containing protein [Dehalococcoidia bacterium]